MNFRLLFVLCCICFTWSTIDGYSDSEFHRDKRFLFEGATHHDPDAYVSHGSLTFRNRMFYLDRKPFRIISGSIHYFRIVPEYWNDRLLKMKAGGLNTVQVLVNWDYYLTGKINNFKKG